MIGTVVGGKYRVVRELGRGGMGAVYEATHVQTARRIAVKIMRSNERNDEKEAAAIARFQREALAVGRLETRHVVQIFDAGTDEATGQPFIAMELLEGEDVSRLIRRLGPLPPTLAAAIVAQACVGLGKAHDAGVVHRDIKPSNLFLCRDEYGGYTVKVLDFGIAKVNLTLEDRVSSDMGTLTETGTLVGSPHYMSPEQVKSSKTIDQRADLWSLGVVLYKCLSGHTPYDAFSTLGEVIVAVCSEDAASVQDRSPWVPTELAAVVQHALSRNINARIASARDFIGELSPFTSEQARITDDMLAPLTDAIRGYVAPRGRPDEPPTWLENTPQTGSRQHIVIRPSPPSSSSSSSVGGGESPPPSSQSQPLAAAFDATVTGSSPSGSLNGSLLTLTADENGDLVRQPRRKAPWVIAAAATLLVALGTFVLYKTGRLSSWMSEPPRSGNQPASAIAVVAITPGSAIASASSSEATNAGGATTTATTTDKSIIVRTEKITVSPANVSVIVDGRTVPVQGGVVAIEGASGSVHKVTLKLGGREVSSDVVLSDKGPIPTQITLAPLHAAAPINNKPKPAGTPTRSNGSFDSRKW